MLCKYLQNLLPAICTYQSYFFHFIYFPSPAQAESVVDLVEYQILNEQFTHLLSSTDVSKRQQFCSRHYACVLRSSLKFRLSILSGTIQGK